MERKHEDIYEIKEEKKQIILSVPHFRFRQIKQLAIIEKQKHKGENVYIDFLTYEQFMMLGDAELRRRFSM